MKVRRNAHPHDQAVVDDMDTPSRRTQPVETVERLNALTLDEAISAVITALRCANPAMATFTLSARRYNQSQNEGTKKRPRVTYTPVVTLTARSGQFYAYPEGLSGALAAEMFRRYPEVSAERVSIWFSKTPWQEALR